MESSTKYIPHNSKKRVLPATSSSCMEPEVMEIPPPMGDWPTKSKTKSKDKAPKRKEVIIHEVIDIDVDEDCNDVMLIDGMFESNKKGKDARATVSSKHGSAIQLDSLDHVQALNKGLASDTNNFDLDGIGSNYMDLYADDYIFDDEYTVLQSHFDNIGIPAGVEAPVPWLQDHMVNMKNKTESGTRSAHSATQAMAYGSDFVQSTGPAHVRTSSSSAGHLQKMERTPFWSSAGPSVRRTLKAQGHNMASVSGSSSSHNTGPFLPHISNTQGWGTGAKGFPQFPTDLHKASSQDPLSFFKKNPYLNDAHLNIYPDDTEDMLLGQDLGGNENEVGSSSMIKNKKKSGSSSSVSRKLKIDDDVMKKYEDFKKFDTVQDHSDHYYFKKHPAEKQPPKSWAKKIQEEWRILEKDLPDTIFVRVYESRMDLLRAVIIGAEGTPYHDGLFFFDVYFPSSYPNAPPHVYYHSGGLRINPNLYESGKVCLSLLNTWSGVLNEKWVPGRSTMLQVLVSIQGLILNAKPYFNEPGYAHSSGSVHGDNNSLRYNERTLILSLKTMVYTMKKPPKNFEELVVGHFCTRVRDILMACKAYMEGAQVGCLVRGGVQDVDEVCKSSSASFKNDVASSIKILVGAFKQIGAKDAEEFLPLSEKAFPVPAAPPPAPYPTSAPLPYPSFSSNIFPTYNYNYPTKYW